MNSPVLQIPMRVRALVGARSGGICEICARRRAGHMHHRRPRKMGGSRRPSTNSPANILHLCPLCHQRIETSSRTRAHSFGWLVDDSIDDPASVPVFLATAYGQQYVWLHDDGTDDLVDLASDFARALAEAHPERDIG